MFQIRRLILVEFYNKLLFAILCALNCSVSVAKAQNMLEYIATKTG